MTTRNIRQLLCSCLFLITTVTPAQTVHTVGLQYTVVDGKSAPFNNISPGDTLRIAAGIRPYLIFKNITGTDSLPIIIINSSGIVEINSDHYFGISMRMCKHIRMTGTGMTGEKYGIRILNRKGSGLSIGDYSSFFEIDHTEIGYSEYAAITAKTDPPCGFDRSMFAQEQTIIHDCYIHHAGNEGMYIGSNFYYGQTLSCNGSNVTVYPPVLKDVHIYNNIVEYCGWDGIQVSSATNARIHNNTVRFDSQALAYFQMSGISLGGGSTGTIYNNRILDGEGIGIFTNALGDVYIYNNEVIRPGKSKKVPSQKYGMYIEDTNSIPGMNFHICNNLIITGTETGIYMKCSEDRKDDIFNNVVIMVDQSAEIPAYIRCIGKKANVFNNFLNSSIDNARFIDPGADDYRLEEGSLLIDAGSDLPVSTIATDINGLPRKQGNQTDLGPSESPYSRVVLIPDETSGDIIYPNPAGKDGKSTILFNNPIEGVVEFRLLDCTGRLLKVFSQDYYQVGRQFKVIDNFSIPYGLNFIQIIKRQAVSMLKISISAE